MEIDKEQNNEESNMLIKRELEEDSNENERGPELNEMEYYCDEPSELIDVKYIEDYSRQNFFLDIEQHNNCPNISFNNQINNNNTNNDYLINQNYNDIYGNSRFSNNNVENTQSMEKNRIFNIEKYPRFKELKKFFNISNDKEGKKHYKNQTVDWDMIQVPKEKHFHFDRKKHRIVFQRKHLKVIYSIISLSPPINFIKCFNMIKEQIGDKTLQNFGKGKSFHIIRENGEEKIVTLKDKKLKLNKKIFINKKRNSINIDKENQYSSNN